MAKAQMEIPGTERVSIPDIEDAAEAYVTVRDKRMALTEKEIAARTNLIDVVKGHVKELSPGEGGTLIYKYDDMVVVLKPGKDHVKVRHDADDSDDEAEEEED